jgi:3-oxoacyl-[acyl-carrier-protein] synthase-1
MVPETQLIETPLNIILSNSFGFGGNCSSLLFKKATS